MKIAIISDIHEDINSLTKALKHIDKAGVDHIACLGDIVGFSVPYYKYLSCRDASACIRLIKSNCKWVVAGNHDLFEIKKLPNYNAGFDYPNNWYQLDYKTKKKIADNKIWLYEENSLDALLSVEDKEYLTTLKPVEYVDCDKYRVALSHFLYPDISGTRADLSLNKELFSKHLKFIEDNNCSFSFSGHAHIEGLCYFNSQEAKIKKFKTINIKQATQSHIVPCLAKGTYKNGFAIFDTNTMIINAIRLK
jgi:predicted phosphodiesterase